MSTSQHHEKNPTDEKKECTDYTSVDLKFVNKCKKTVITYMLKCANAHLITIRPDNKKQITIDAGAKDQIMYILCKLIETISTVSDLEDDYSEGGNKISMCIEKNTDVMSPTDLFIFKYLTHVSSGCEYNLLGEPVEEYLVSNIYDFIVDEDLLQHTVELFLLFVTKLAKQISNTCWESTKRVNGKIVNGLIRNMDCNNTSPHMFNKIFEFSNYAKLQNKKKK